MDQQEFYAVIGETMVNGGKTPPRLLCPECRQLMGMTRQQLEKLEELTGVGPMLGCCCQKKQPKEPEDSLVVLIPIESRVVMTTKAEIELKVTGTSNKKLALQLAEKWINKKNITLLEHKDEQRYNEDGKWQVKGRLKIKDATLNSEEPNYYLDSKR